MSTPPLRRASQDPCRKHKSCPPGCPQTRSRPCTHMAVRSPQLGGRPPSGRRGNTGSSTVGWPAWSPQPDTKDLDLDAAASLLDLLGQPLQPGQDALALSGREVAHPAEVHGEQRERRHRVGEGLRAATEISGPAWM